jgi:hypothetical protein
MMKIHITGRAWTARQMAVFLAAPIFCAAIINAQEVLTNSQIISMTKALLKDELIVEMIQNEPGRYVVTSTALIALKQQGVSDSAIAAMRAKMGNKQDALAAKAEGAPRSDWQIGTVHDKMTGAPTVMASRDIPVEGGAWTRVTASCGRENAIAAYNSIPDQYSAFLKDGMGLPDGLSKLQRRGPELDTTVLSLRFKYLPRPGSGLAVHRSQLAQHVSTDSSGNATVSPPRSCSFLSVMVDGHGRSGEQSDVCSQENVVAVSFLNFRAKDATRALGLGMPAGASNDPFGFSKWMGNVLDKLAEMQDTTIATMEEVFRANEIRVEMPLTNGNSVVTAVEPQEPGFKKFAAACERELGAKSPAGAPDAPSDKSKQPSAVESAIEEAKARFDDLDYQAALNILDRVLKLAPDNQEAKTEKEDILKVCQIENACGPKYGGHQ